jgi:hypothetical protein
MDIFHTCGAELEKRKREEGKKEGGKEEKREVKEEKKTGNDKYNF